MAPHKLTRALMTTFSLLIHIPLLPLFLAIWIQETVLPHAPLPRFTEDAQGNLIPVPEPPKPKPKRPPTWYAKCWTSFKKLPFIVPIVERWSRIVISTMLLVYAVFSCAVLEQSLVRFIPWLIHHYQNDSYRREHETLWWNDLHLHLAAFTLTCAPLMGCIGVGVSFLYYSRKVWKYDRYAKGMVRKPGGRGYYMPKEEKHEPKQTLAPLEKVHIAQPDLDMEMRQGTAERLEASPHGYAGEVLFDAVQAPEPVVVELPKPPVKFHAFTQQGIQAIWTGWNNKPKGGYDGRDVRKRNFEEDVEMENREGRK
jgi:hypothetical protein